MAHHLWTIIAASIIYNSCAPISSPNKDQERDKDLVYASFGSSPVDEDQERKFSLMEREIEYLMGFWPGAYDNVEQLSLEKDAGKKTRDSGQHMRVHSRITQVHNDAFGPYLLYVEETKNNSNHIFRRHLYQLIPVDSAYSIRVKVYDFKSDDVMLDGNTLQEEIRKLSPSSMTHDDSCDIILKREGHTFKGTSGGSTCSSSDAELMGQYQMRISENSFWFKYQNSGMSSVQSHNPDEGWFMLDKARCFICMVDFPREKGGRPVETKYYVDMHDQGGQFEFDYTDGRHMVLTMRNTWSYGMQRNTFVIVIQEGDLNGPTLIYSWGQEGADRIGMNPGWIRIQCDLKNEKNVKLQQELRPDS